MMSTRAQRLIETLELNLDMDCAPRIPFISRSVFEVRGAWYGNSGGGAIGINGTWNNSKRVLMAWILLRRSGMKI